MTDEPTLPSSERPEAAPSTDRGGHQDVGPDMEGTLQRYAEIMRGVVKDEVRAGIKAEMSVHAKDELLHHKRVEATMKQVLVNVRRVNDRLGHLEQRLDEHEARLLRLEHPDVDFDAEPGPEPSGA